MEPTPDIQLSRAGRDATLVPSGACQNSRTAEHGRGRRYTPGTRRRPARVSRRARGRRAQRIQPTRRLWPPSGPSAAEHGRCPSRRRRAGSSRPAPGPAHRARRSGQRPRASRLERRLARVCSGGCGGVLGRTSRPSGTAAGSPSFMSMLNTACGRASIAWRRVGTKMPRPRYGKVAPPSLVNR